MGEFFLTRLFFPRCDDEVIFPKERRGKTQREATREKRQGGPEFGEEAEESEIVFMNTS